MKNKLIIDIDSVDSCETFVCKCEVCLNDFTMGCYDSRRIKYCPMCGKPVEVEEIEEF